MKSSNRSSSIADPQTAPVWSELWQWLSWSVSRTCSFCDLLQPQWLRLIDAVCNKILYSRGSFDVLQIVRAVSHSRQSRLQHHTQQSSLLPVTISVSSAPIDYGGRLPPDCLAEWYESHKPQPPLARTTRTSWIEKFPPDTPPVVWHP